MTTAVNYNDILSAYSAYSPAIRPYLLYADTLEEIRSKLTKTTRLVFLDLVARTNIADASKPIMVRVDRTAEKLGISEKSVSRTIRMMRKNGWLDASQDHDGRNNNGEFAWREYLVTPMFRALLRMPQLSSVNANGDPTSPSEMSPSAQAVIASPGNVATAVGHAATSNHTLNETKQPRAGFDRVHKALEILERRAAQQTKAPQPSVKPEPSTEVNAPADKPVQIGENAPSETVLSAGPIYAVNKVFLKKEASLQSEALKKEASFAEPSKNPNVKAGKTIRLPADLLEMKELLDILPEGICALMALAKRTGQRLQDVWKAKKDVLLNSGAKNGRAVNYIRYLLNCGEDFSYVARTKIEQQTRPRATQAPFKPQDGAADVSQPKAAANTASATPDSSRKDLDLDLITIADACRHKRFVHVSKGIRVKIFDGAAEIVAGAKIAILAGWDQMQWIYRDIALGELVEVRE